MASPAPAGREAEQVEGTNLAPGLRLQHPDLKTNANAASNIQMRKDRRMARDDPSSCLVGSASAVSSARTSSSTANRTSVLCRTLIPNLNFLVSYSFSNNDNDDYNEEEDSLDRSALTRSVTHDPPRWASRVSTITRRAGGARQRWARSSSPPR